MVPTSALRKRSILARLYFFEHVFFFFYSGAPLLTDGFISAVTVTDTGNCSLHNKTFFLLARPRLCATDIQIHQFCSFAMYTFSGASRC